MKKYIKSNDNYYERNKVSPYEVVDGTCPDCGKKIGEYHMDYCDIEKCPICETQMYSCSCWEAFGVSEEE